MESVGSYKGADEVYMSGLEATELRLGLPGTPPTSAVLKAKRALEEDNEPTVDQIPQQQESSESASPPAPPPAKAQVVGWPPVQSFRRRNNGAHQQQQANKKASPPEEKQVASSAAATAASTLLVKVSMDGAPYLRKVDLGSYNGYKDLRLAIDAMFRCFSPLSLQYMMTYEDKDGDWMLVGDVPWEMFASSCKRLRIMKSTTEA